MITLSFSACKSGETCANLYSRCARIFDHLLVMIGRMIKDAESTIYLLGYNKPYHLVREYQAGKRPGLFGCIFYSLCNAKSPAYKDHQRFNALVHALLKLL